MAPTTKPTAGHDQHERLVPKACRVQDTLDFGGRGRHVGPHDLHARHPPGPGPYTVNRLTVSARRLEISASSWAVLATCSALALSSVAAEALRSAWRSSSFIWCRICSMARLSSSVAVWMEVMVRDSSETPP